MPDRFQFILRNTNNITVKIYNFDKTLNLNLVNSENQYISTKEQSQETALELVGKVTPMWSGAFGKVPQLFLLGPWSPY